jgi:hypothetical protein
MRSKKIVVKPAPTHLNLFQSCLRTKCASHVFIPVSSRFPPTDCDCATYPPLFSKRLAERLTRQCHIFVAEGYEGAQLRPGHAWITPGDFHEIVVRRGTTVHLSLHQAPPEHFCRPAVDVLFRSVAKTDLLS